MTTQITYRVTTPATRRTDFQYPGGMCGGVHIVRAGSDDHRARTEVLYSKPAPVALLDGLLLRVCGKVWSESALTQGDPYSTSATAVQRRALANDLIRAGTGRRPAPYGPTARYPR